MRKKGHRDGGTEGRGGGRKTGRRDRKTVLALCVWFREHGRDLPWRTSPRDPYRSLVSEFMLQQTQVARVLEKYEPFLARFGSVAALAAAPEREVLAAWSGLGYYRRARHLHAAARQVMARFGGRVPETVVELRTLPGIGRYTAGAVASMVHGRAEALVDGNVARVLMRVEGRDFAHGSAEGMRWAWGRAEELVGRAREPGVWNEALMELGALVCLARGPRCSECPIAGECRARKEGREGEIPRAKARVARRALYCASVVVKDVKGRVLVEPRGDSGMWAGMWQAPTLESVRKRATAEELREWLRAGAVERVEEFEHTTTHRQVVFEVWRARAGGSGARVAARASAGARWVSRKEAMGLPLSNPQRRILSATL